MWKKYLYSIIYLFLFNKIVQKMKNIFISRSLTFVVPLMEIKILNKQTKKEIKYFFEKKKCPDVAKR